MKIARIYTEAKNVMWIRNTVTVAFSGATFFEGLGLWEGQFEQSLVIELHWTNPNDRIWKTNIELLAHKIADNNKQQIVRVAFQDVECVDITGS